MKFLDANPNVISWTKNHGISLEYPWNGLFRRYVPDFLVRFVDGHVCLEEVKGWIREKERFEAKKKSAIRYAAEKGMTYRVLFFDDLEKE